MFDGDENVMIEEKKKSSGYKVSYKMTERERASNVMFRDRSKKLDESLMIVLVLAELIGVQICITVKAEGIRGVDDLLLLFLEWKQL